MRNGLIGAILALTLILSACSKGGENSQPAIGDSTAIADSLARLARGAITKEHLAGIWVRHTDTPPGERGYNLLSDGRLLLLGYFTLGGDRWDLAGDTLVLYMHTEGDTMSVPHYFTIGSLSDSNLAIKEAVQSAPSVDYHRRTSTIPKRYTEFYNKQLDGKLSPGQVVTQTFTVPTLFDGGITLTSDSSEVQFYLLKDGVNLTPEPVRVWNGRFVPGTYTLRVMFIRQGRRADERSRYRIVIEER